MLNLTPVMFFQLLNDLYLLNHKILTNNLKK